MRYGNIPYRSIPYVFFRNHIYPRTHHLRGATRLNVLTRKLAALGIDNYDGEPQSIFERGEWDNLFILDACRHDIYCEFHPEAEKRVTKVSKTRRFLKRTFSDSSLDLSDIIYVAGNPHLNEGVFKDVTGKDPGEVFFAVYNVYDGHWKAGNGVLPEDVVNQAKSAEKLFPDKKKIVHFMQPHAPYLECDIDEDRNIFRGAGYCEGTRQKVRECYRLNLERVLGCVDELNRFMDGRTVVTADHGEFLGENGIYGHPQDAKSYTVREVPWHVLSES